MTPANPTTTVPPNPPFVSLLAVGAVIFALMGGVIQKKEDEVAAETALMREMARDPHAAAMARADGVLALVRDGRQMLVPIGPPEDFASRCDAKIIEQSRGKSPEEKATLTRVVVAAKLEACYRKTLELEATIF